MRVPDVNGLAALLKGKATFDGEGDDCCPFCKKVLMPGRRWLDHKSSLAGEVRRYLEVGERCRERIYEVLSNYDVPPNGMTIDWKDLAQAIMTELFG